MIVEIERGDGLDTGMFRVTAEVYTGGDVAPAPAPGYDARPGVPAGGRRLRPAGRWLRPAARRRAAAAATSGWSPATAAPTRCQMGSTVIGRGDQANLRLPDVGISRRHARLDFDGGQVVLTDLGSTNGTMVNGQRVSAVALNPGDMIQLGTTTLTFRVDG